MISRSALVSLVALALAPTCSSAASVAAGSILSVKGEIDPHGRLLAEEIEAGDRDDRSVKGPLLRWDARRRTLVFGPGLEVELAADARILQPDGAPADESELTAGRLLKAKVEGGGGALRAVELRLRERGSSDVTLEATLTGFDPQAAGGHHFRLLGVPVVLGPATEYRDVPPPRGVRFLSSEERDRPVRVEPGGRLAVGSWVEAEGDVGPEGVVRLAEVVGQEGEPEESVEGLIAAIDVSTRSVTIGPVTLPVAPDARLRSAEGEDRLLASFQPGERVKAYLEIVDGRRVVERLRGRSSEDRDLEIAGRVEWMAPVTARELRFRVLGVELIGDDSTEWRSVIAPRLVGDEDDERPSELISLGRFGFFTGEVRFDWGREENYDLGDLLEDDFEDARLRADLEWLFPTTEHFSGQAELRLQADWEIVNDEDGETENDTDVSLGETYFLWSGVLGERGSIMVGRSRFEDRRDWWYARNLDSVRLFFDWERFRLELSAMEQLLEPSNSLRDVEWLHARGDFRIGRRQRVSVLWIDRDDGDEEPLDGTWYGLSAAGRTPGGAFRWTAEAAWAEGDAFNEETDLVEPFDGFAWDATLHWELPGEWDPTFTVGRAEASGDGDAFDGRSDAFRQTGLQDNAGKWAGVTSFNYYGEVLDPELTNLEIDSLGFGFEPARDLSIEIAWHRYRLDELVPALETIDAGDGRRLDLTDDDLGEEWNLIVGWERFEHFEVELNIGRFEPGGAFLGDPDPAFGTFLKLKWIF